MTMIQLFSDRALDSFTFSPSPSILGGGDGRHRTHCVIMNDYASKDEFSRRSSIPSALAAFFSYKSAAFQDFKVLYVDPFRKLFLEKNQKTCLCSS
jgi:hypothetical protein